MRAGVFDSGVGGLTVVKSLLESHLFESIVYFGDTARVPYGSKDKNTIIRYALEGLEFFKNFDIDLFIVACNTVSAYAIPELRQSAWCEVVGVIEPGVRALVRSGVPREATVLVLGTQATVRSGRYAELLQEIGFHSVLQKATGLFVPIVEEGIFEGAVLEAAMRHYFEGISKPEAVILGCTHFPLISKRIQAHFPDAALVHSGEAIVEHLYESLGLTSRFESTALHLFASENPQWLKQVAKEWLELARG